MTALKNYRAVLIGFAAGGGVALLAGWAFSGRWGVPGAMLGFTAGHALLLLILCGAIFKELGSFEVGQADFLVCFRKYWDLALGGLFYNLGIWIDKFLYWWVDPAAEPVAGILHTAPIYDRVVYFSFLAIVPGMAVFLLKLETQFALKNESFYQHVLKKGTLRQIVRLKEEMIESLRDGFALLLKVQGLCTAALVLGADRILGLLGLGAVQAGVFQISLLGGFLLVVFLATLTVLYYLDKRRDALWCVVVFTLLNGAVTGMTIVAGERWYGLGFLVAAAVGLFVAALRVNHHLQNLDYDVFTSQPVYG